MSYVDRIDLSIPSEEITSILSLFASAQEKLELLPQVGPQERKHLAKLGLKNEALALQIIEVGRLNPELIPRGIDFELIDRDRVAREQLRALKLILERLLGRVTDAMLLTGVDLYAAALSIYHCLRRSAKTAALRESVAELKRGFARPGRKKQVKQEKPQKPVTAQLPNEKVLPATKPLASEPQTQPFVPVAPPVKTPPSLPVESQGQHISPPRQSVSFKPQPSGVIHVDHYPVHLLPIYFAGGSTPFPSSDHVPAIIPQEIEQLTGQ